MFRLNFEETHQLVQKLLGGRDAEDENWELSVCHLEISKPDR
jgi:hypothetical protein